MTSSVTSQKQMVRLRRNTLDGHTNKVWCIVPFPDNERMVSASNDGSVIVWKFRTKGEEFRWCHKGVTTVAVSPDGKTVVTGGSDGDIQLWDIDSQNHLAGPWKRHKERVWSMAWSPDGKRIASCSADGTLIIWDARSMSSSGEVICGPLQTGHETVRAVAYCPKGGKVATSGHNSQINIWDDNTGDLQATLCSQSKIISSVAWTKDGSRVISGSVEGTARIWDPEQKVVCEMFAHTDAINYIAVSDHIFATASADRTICLWNIKTHPHQRLNGLFDLSSSTSNRDEARCVALTPDENTIVACTERNKVYTFDIREIVSAIKGPVEEVVSPRILL